MMKCLDGSENPYETDCGIKTLCDAQVSKKRASSMFLFASDRKIFSLTLHPSLTISCLGRPIRPLALIIFWLIYFLFSLISIRMISRICKSGSFNFILFRRRLNGMTWRPSTGHVTCHHDQ
ncbi:hypothetical protein BJ165DRAFT_1518125 [Panaeolus papilionaceus]|nr:hypothetical protein BJ165DRAFT_1518125 [Panaeolus papilionaceus]